MRRIRSKTVSLFTWLPVFVIIGFLTASGGNKATVQLFFTSDLVGYLKPCG